MKRKIFDLRNWARVTQHRQLVQPLEGVVIVDFYADLVIRPFDAPTPQKPYNTRILDNGYRWVRAHPTGTGEGVMGSALTVQLNAEGVPVQFYVDIHGGEGIDESGLPWHDDLYLDVIGAASPQDAWLIEATNIIDGEELDEAVKAGLVTPQTAEATWKEARAIAEVLKAGTYWPISILKQYVQEQYVQGQTP